MNSGNLTHTSMEMLHPIITESIREGGQFVFYPSGISMLPTIKEREDCVVLVEADDLCKNDLILYRRKCGKYVLHRIMGIKHGEYILCGDNQFRYEYGITSDMIIAMASEIRKKDGTIINLDDIHSYKPSTRKYIRRMMMCFRMFLGRIYRRIFKNK